MSCGGQYPFPGPSALCRGCAQAGRGGEGQQYGLGAMTTAKPRPLLAPGETRAYPVLPLRDIVVFPHVIAPLFVGRKKSILALEEVTVRHLHPARRPEERVRRRSGNAGDLR